MLQTANVLKSNFTRPIGCRVLPGCQMFKKWPLKLGRMYHLTRMMDLMPSDFAAGNSTLPAFAMIPNQQNFTRHDERFIASQPSSRTAKSASSRYFQERSSTVTFILKFFSYSVVDLLIIFLFSPNFRHLSQRFRRIQSWYCFHLHGARLLTGDFELWFDFCNAKFLQEHCE